MNKESDPPKIKNDTSSSISIHMPVEDELSENNAALHNICFHEGCFIEIRMSIPLRLAKYKELQRIKKPSL